MEADKASHAQTRPQKDESMELAPLRFADMPHLHRRIVRNLAERLNATEPFPVQRALVERLIRQHSRIRSCSDYARLACDMCVNAATGSGKTLAYTIPIVDALVGRRVCRLRALVVLPTRELCAQVRAIIEQVASGTGLRVAVANGSRPLATESTLLCGTETQSGYIPGGQSAIDILVATPGRLVDHIQHTRGFTLQHLEYLVLDEADRLLNQGFQEWLSVVSDELRDPRCLQLAGPGVHAGWHEPANAAEYRPPICEFADDRRARNPLCKVVLSATMTRDPEKLEELQLRNPVFLLVGDDGVIEGEEMHVTYTLPASLREHAVHVELGLDKPLALHALLAEHNLRSVIVFAGSTSTAARLARLLELLGVAQEKTDMRTVGLFTSDMTRDERRQALHAFKQGAVDVLVCSDLMARGVDIPTTRNIINYDAPSSVRAYVHRAGRTARAGQDGDVWTLLAPADGRRFARAIVHAPTITRVGESIHREHIRADVPAVKAAKESYAVALAQLAEAVRVAKHGG